MNRPYKYQVICNKTLEIISESNYLPSQHTLFTWEETENPNIRKQVQTRTVYEDLRYEAKLRLFNYINGIKPIAYKPFEGTEIGKSLPILSF